MKLKLNRWEFDVTNNDWILDNGSCYQCMTIRTNGSYIDSTRGVPVKISKKRFKELQKQGLIIKDPNPHYDWLPGCTVYKFNVESVKREIIYNKLVRDNIPEIIKNSNKTPIYEVLDDKDYYEALKLKLVEEINEFFKATNDNDVIEELADVYEVLASLVNVRLNSDQRLFIAKKQKEKYNDKGGFTKKFFLEKVIEE